MQETIKAGAKGRSVQDLQIQLNLVVLSALIPDGDFGAMTKAAVAQFQHSHKAYKLAVTGDADAATREALQHEYLSKPKFVIVTDAGHGGLDPRTGEYTTPAKNGKKYRHKGLSLHKGEWFLEGVENRIVANLLEAKLRAKGICAAPCYHPYKDYWGTTNDEEELHRRGTFAKPYLERGFSGGYMSIHSNAAGDDTMTQEEIDDIRGGYIFTTRGETFSDPIAQQGLIINTRAWGEHWVRLADEKESAKNGGRITLGSDKEKNFAVINRNEIMAADYKNSKWFAILYEDDFFTSRPGSLFLMEKTTREKRSDCMLELCLFAQSKCTR